MVMAHAVQARVAAGRATCRNARPWALSRTRWAPAYRRHRSMRLDRGCSPLPSTVRCGVMRLLVTGSAPPRVLRLVNLLYRDLLPAPRLLLRRLPPWLSVKGICRCRMGGPRPSRSVAWGLEGSVPHRFCNRVPDPSSTNEDDEDESWGGWGGDCFPGPVFHGARPAGVPDDFGFAAPAAAGCGGCAPAGTASGRFDRADPWHTTAAGGWGSGADFPLPSAADSPPGGVRRRGAKAKGRPASTDVRLLDAQRASDAAARAGAGVPSGGPSASGVWTGFSAELGSGGPCSPSRAARRWRPGGAGSPWAG